MKYALLSLLAFFFVQGAQANIDVRCFMGSCLTEGWHAYDSVNGQSTVVECVDESCEQEGWITLVNDREMGHTICKPGGCFEKGWLNYDSRTGRLMSDVTCGRGFAGGRCLEFGWNTFVPNKGGFQTRCQNGDCTQNGWIVRVPGFATQRARCKPGGCFTTGWNLYR